MASCDKNNTVTDTMNIDLSKYADISKQLNNTETEINAATTPDEIQKANTILKTKLVDLNKQLLAISKNIVPGDTTTSKANLDEQEKKLDEIMKNLKELNVNYELESSREYTRKTQITNVSHDKHILKYWYYAFGFLNFLMIMVLVIYVIMLRK